MTIYNIPYTYQIIWSSTGMKYYGVRYAKNCHPNDLWQTYFTSSVKVAEYVKEHGNPDIIQIRKTFSGDDAVNKAKVWEHRVLRKMKVIYRNDYLNEGDSRSISPAASSKARTGVSPGNKGKPQPEYIKDKKRKPKPVVECPHCGKIGGISAMHRHHFNNCGLGIKKETLDKIKNINTTKGQRPIVQRLKYLKKNIPKEIQQILDKQSNIKYGWYQLPTEILENAVLIYESYLS
jgi:hypothetical protein